ncbi:MAG TPA: PspA/IM30 family protein [Aggregatilinea sp.]|jgi:phage shock protein A|uniref:PspA/IM30 family protein n=1 Tax=Aggregatilinea sp. TaxID=2806333 RepID=UPI002C79B253|nr:PspA/IM30 family protein [Aggregatilinea sp.]HML22042.1 PspA/IM30 family protein [Aggregatilinea sp.]
MASLLQKINTLISANIHGLVDQALEANSVKVMDEYVRQAERNLDALDDSAATIGGTVKTLKRKYEEFAAAAEKLDRDIDTLLVRGKADLAAAAQAELNQKQQLAQEYYEQWQSQEQEYRRMLDAKLKLEAKLTTIKQEREHLKALLELVEAKELTTKTVKNLDDLAGVGDEDVQRLGDQIRARLDREEARLEMATTNVRDQIDEAIGTSEIELQLQERRQRLGLGSEGG